MSFSKYMSAIISLITSTLDDYHPATVVVATLYKRSQL